MSSLKRLIGAGLGSGFSPIAPGTAGSLLALVPAYFSLQFHPLFGPLTLTIFFSLLSLWVTKACVEAWGDDPGTMVIDEFAGQTLVFTAMPIVLITNDWWIILSAFVLFRLFDILKPLGINKIQELKNGWGILLDDVLAGFYALICLKSLIFIVQNFSGS
jgi:phosphatidylglycerophosphatase A